MGNTKKELLSRAYREKIAKKFKSRVDNVLQNFATYFHLIQSNENPELIKRMNTFMHDEKKGLFAIDQRPPASGEQLRLYIYPSIEEKVLYVILFGNKKTQKSDIHEAHADIERIKNGK